MTLRVARRWPAPLALLCAAVVLLGGPPGGRPAVAAAAGDPVVAAAGDIACDAGVTDPDPSGRDRSACQQRATSDLVLAEHPDAVLALGDLQYQTGALSQFTAGYDTSWGRYRAITRPAVGNHEYSTPGAAGYFDYFGAAAGSRGEGWYSSQLGAWHLVALNANCSVVGCTAGSPQERWLRADLAAHPAACTLAFFHQPRWTSSPRGGDAALAPLWQALYDGSADLVLNGHEHTYERFAPQDPQGRADPRGLREIVVGTGGRNLTPAGPATANSEVRTSATFGVLVATLHPTGYDWRFVGVDGATADSGSAECSPSPSPVSPPPVSASPVSPSPVSPSPTCVVPTARLASRVSVAGSAVGVAVQGGPGAAVDLLAVTPPDGTPRTVRSAVLGPDGSAGFTVRPVRGTVLSAVSPGCAASTAVALQVRTALSLSVASVGARTLRLSGRTLPARPGGQPVSVVRVLPDGRQVLVARTPTDGDGSWRLVRAFLSPGRLALVARVAGDATNAAGQSAVRPADVR